MIETLRWPLKKGDALKFLIKPLPAKAGRFLLRLKVIYFKPQNKEPQNIEVKNIVLFL